MSVNLHQIKHFMIHFFLAKRKGHGIHSPFAYKLCEEVFYNHNAFYDFRLLNSVRKGLLVNEKTIHITDLGAGSKTFKENNRKISDIALKGISSKKQSEILYKLVNYLNCNSCIELGSSLGLSTLYLALANKKASIVSIEGSKELTDFASQLAKKNNVVNIQFINENFDKAFPEILKTIDGIDLLYADGNHTYEATVRYFHMALEKKHSNSIFIFDDIYWSAEMTEAWKEIKQHPSVTLSIDTFNFGMVFFKEEVREKRALRLYL
jgi:predicted O-methyltransferase YrrM